MSAAASGPSSTSTLKATPANSLCHDRPRRIIRVAISSANIPAVSFVITAIMPARGHQWNEAIDSSGPELPIASVKERDQTMAQFIPQPYCNSFAIARMNTYDVVEWH